MINDLKFAVRQLFKSPVFTLVAVLSLGIGIGACTAVFSIVNGVLLRSLPVPHPEELRVVQWSGTEPRLRSFSGDYSEVGNRLVGNSVSPDIFFNLREKCSGVADVFAFAPMDDISVRRQGEPSSGRGMVVSDNFFLASVPGRLWADYLVLGRMSRMPFSRLS